LVAVAAAVAAVAVATAVGKTFGWPALNRGSSCERDAATTGDPIPVAVGGGSGRQCWMTGRAVFLMKDPASLYHKRTIVLHAERQKGSAVVTSRRGEVLEQQRLDETTTAGEYGVGRMGRRRTDTVPHEQNLQAC